MPLTLNFSNGQIVDAAQLNALVQAINAVEAAQLATAAQVAATTKTQLIVVANKANQFDFAGDGQAQNIGGWAIAPGQPNVDSCLTVGTGAVKPTVGGSYTFNVRLLVSVSSATSPRAKLTLVWPGGEIILDEDTTAESAGAIANYRRLLAGSATINLNPNQSAFIKIAVWGATQARIFADANTELRVSRAIVS